MGLACRLGLTVLLASAGCGGIITDDGGGSASVGGASAGGSTAAGFGTAGGSAGTGGAATTGGAVTGAGGTVSTYETVAQAICQKVLSLGCPHDQLTSCVESATALVDLADGIGCGARVAAFFNCVVARPGSDFECDPSTGSATPRAGVCASEQFTLQQCIG